MGYEQASSQQRTARTIRLEVEHQAILAGAFEADAVDRIMEHGELSAENGEAASIKGAIDAYRQRNPDGFCKLGPLASNEKLPPMTRFASAYKDVLKQRERVKLPPNAQRWVDRHKAKA